MNFYKDLHEVIQEMFKTTEAFTSFNITLKLQSMNHDIKHRDVKDNIVEAIEDELEIMLEAADFEKSYSKSNGFFLYHKTGYDVESFKPSTKLTNNNLSNVKSIYDKRGRFNISTKLSNMIDSNLFVIVNEIFPDTNIRSLVIATYSYKLIDPDGKILKANYKDGKNIRISKRDIKKVFGSIPDKLLVIPWSDDDGVTNKLIITT